jgi:hypothetical protein
MVPNLVSGMDIPTAKNAFTENALRDTHPKMYFNELLVNFPKLGR